MTLCYLISNVTFNNMYWNKMLIAKKKGDGSTYY